MAGFKFRVTYRVLDQGEQEGRTVEFRYRTLARARSNYRAILLEFYRMRYAEKWEICLNRMRDPCWVNPIFRDSWDA